LRSCVRPVCAAPLAAGPDEVPQGDDPASSTDIKLLKNFEDIIFNKMVTHLRVFITFNINKTVTHLGNFLSFV
jgi:hypothetical protein